MTKSIDISKMPRGVATLNIIVYDPKSTSSGSELYSEILCKFSTTIHVNEAEKSSLQTAIGQAGNVYKTAKCWVDPDGTQSSQSVLGYYGDTTRASVIKFQLEIMNLMTKK